jgi:hypothetical protein
MHPELLIAIVSIISFVYIGLVLFVAHIARRLESKLLVMGLLTAAAAVAYGILAGGPSVQLAGQGVSTQLSGGLLAEMLMRLGVILVLAGLGVACCSHCCPTVPESRSPQP